jgi:hypothetical protein
MIRFTRKGVTRGEIWFDEEPVAPLPDILICRQRSQPWPSGQCSNFLTLLLDLTQDETTLFGTFGKHNRDKIRKVARDGEGTSIFIDEPARELDAFCRFYDLFAAGKGGVSRADRSWLDAATGLGRLILSRAAQNGEVRVWHSYIVLGDRARQIHSASLFRAEDKALQASIGRLNRWLIWQDILEFKRRGVRIFDFGGLFEDESSPVAVGINHFKQEFGGIKAKNFDCTVALTWKGRVYLTLSNLRGWVRTIKAAAWVRLP